MTKLDVNFGSVSTCALQDIFTYCINLREVVVQSCPHLDDNTITMMAKNCTRLNSLFLMGGRNVTTAGLVEMATHCSTLTSLMLMYVPISDQVLLQLALNCHNLARLRITHCQSEAESVTETGLLAVLERCTCLTSLKVTYVLKCCFPLVLLSICLILDNYIPVLNLILVSNIVCCGHI